MPGRGPKSSVNGASQRSPEDIWAKETQKGDAEEEEPPKKLQDGATVTEDGLPELPQSIPLSQGKNQKKQNISEWWYCNIIMFLYAIA